MSTVSNKVEGKDGRDRLARIDVKAVRKSLGKTQEEFAASFALPVGTVREWEQRRRDPDAPARALLTLIAADPARVERIIAEALSLA